MSSLNSSFIEQVNTKYEAYLLIHDPAHLISLLYSKYGDIEEDFNLLYANQLIYNLPTKLNCFYKELKFTNVPIEYLKRIYKLTETFVRIPKLSAYYKNYHQFFCHPTLRHFKFCKIVCKYQDKKAEIYYRNNYMDTKKKESIREKEEKEENKDIKKSLSFSLSSLDNVTNNKIIFDKQTRKILDKSETELKNNNYYNTLVLDSSRSNLFASNGLISKRTDRGGDDSFEKYIHSLVEYQFTKSQNKNKFTKNDRKFIKNKKLKNIIINNNNFNPNKYYKIKNNICQSHREPNKLYISKIYSNKSKIANNKMNRLNNNNSAKSNNNYISKIKLKNKSLYTSSTRLMNNKNNTKEKNKKEYNINYPITLNNQNSNKNKTYIYTNSENNTINTTGINNNKNNSNLSKVFYNSNVNHNKNLSIYKTLKLAQNNIKNISKLIEYLKQSKNKENNNLTLKASLHKKNCFSPGENEHKNLMLFLKEKNRLTKKQLNINKTAKINTNPNITHNGKNSRKEQKTKHTKNKTFDYNAISQMNNLTKNSNKKSNEDYKTLLNNKTKKKVFKIIDNNNFQSNKKYFSKINKISKNKKGTLTPSSNKMVNKISMTQNGSKDKNNKKDLTFKIISSNNKKLELDLNKEINSLQNKKYYNYIYISENNPNSINNLSYKGPFPNSSKTIKTNNFILSPNSIVGNNAKSRIPKNLDLLHISPSNNNQIFNNKLFFFKKNISYNSNKNSNNNIYGKKSINKDNKILIKKKEDKKVTPNNSKFNNTTKELYKNISLNNYNSFNRYSKPTNSLYSENKSLSRNKKKFSCKKIINYKKSNIYKANSNSGFVGDKLKYNFILNNNSKNNMAKNNGKGNIKISIKKNKIDIKDSILHIDKLYIKKDNFSKNNLMSRVYSDIDCSSSHRKKIDEIKVDFGGSYRIRSGRDIKENNEKINTIDYSPLQLEYSPKIINVHRNFNLIIKNKDIKNKYK